MIVNNPTYNSLPEQVEQNRKDIEEIKSSHLIDVDDELSTQSTNAVQNKVITEALDTEEFERKQADNDLDTGKVAKSNTSNILYGTNNDGEQTTYGIGTASGNIPKYDADARLQSSSPSGNTDVANKQYVDNLVNPTQWQDATPNTTTLYSGSCKYCKVGKIVFCYIDNVVINSGISGGGSGAVELFSGLPTTNQAIVFILPAQNSIEGCDLRCILNNATISLHWSPETSFGDANNHHNLIFSYVEA